MPDQEFKLEDDTIRGRNQVVYLSNLYREVEAAPARRDKIIKRFVDSLCLPVTAEFGHEVWEETKGRIVPVLKPRTYVEPKAPPSICRPPNGWPTWSFAMRSRPTRCFVS